MQITFTFSESEADWEALELLEELMVRHREEAESRAGRLRASRDKTMNECLALGTITSEDVETLKKLQEEIRRESLRE